LHESDPFGENKIRVFREESCPKDHLLGFSGKNCPKDHVNDVKKKDKNQN